MSMNSALRIMMFSGAMLTGSIPPPGSFFMITEDNDNMITEDGDNMITEG